MTSSASVPRVSIVIPTYNMARYLPFALNSALAQGYPDIEVIVLNDGSTDDTAELVRRYLSHIRYHPQDNQGLVASLNRGIEMASGEYVRFLDADDVLLPDSLAWQVALLDGNPRVALVHGQAYVMDEAGNVCDLQPPTRDAARVMPSPQAFRWLLRGSSIRKSTVMVRKAALQRVGPFQPASFPGEDWDMWLRIAAYYDLAYIPRPLAYYRVHRNSITAGYTLSSFTGSHLHTLRSLFARPDLRYPQLENLAYACLDRTTAVVAARLRQRAPFARYLTRALRSQPRLFLEGETWNTLYEGAKALLPLPVLRVVRGAKRTIVSRRRVSAVAAISAFELQGDDVEGFRFAQAEAARGTQGESHG